VLEFEENGEQRSTCLNARIVAGDVRHARVFYGTFFAFAFLVPLVAVSLLYGAMVRRLLVTGARRRADGRQAETTRAKRRVTRLVVAVVVTFAACWLPMQVRDGVA